jgi:hypothetical protein
MKRNFLWAILVPAIILVQCSKNKNDTPRPDLLKGLLAYFELNNSFYDSTGNVTVVAKSAQVTSFLDRRNNAGGAVWCNGGAMTAEVNEWKAYPITVSMWVLPGAADASNYFLTSNGATIGLAQNGSKMGFVISHPMTKSALAETVDPGSKWVHIAGTYDGKDIRTYIDGELAATENHPGEPDVINALTLAYMNNVFWKGGLDDLRFYNRLLSEEEIALLARP